jgi:hypothetical protein
MLLFLLAIYLVIIGMSRKGLGREVCGDLSFMDRPVPLRGGKGVVLSLNNGAEKILKPIVNEDVPSENYSRVPSAL